MLRICLHAGPGCHCPAVCASPSRPKGVGSGLVSFSDFMQYLPLFVEAHKNAKRESHVFGGAEDAKRLLQQTRRVSLVRQVSARRLACLSSSGFHPPSSARRAACCRRTQAPLMPSTLSLNCGGLRSLVLRLRARAGPTTSRMRWRGPPSRTLPNTEQSAGYEG